MAWTTPKTDWTTGELVSASDMNAIGEDLAALRSLSATVAVYTTTQNVPIDSNTFVDVDSDNLNLTITTEGGDVLVHFHGSTRHDESSATVYFDLDVDGNRQGGNGGIMESRGNNYHGVSFTRLIQNLSAGSHTFKLQWRESSSSSGRRARLTAHAQFWVREI